MMLSVCIHKIANSQTVASHPTRHFFKFLKELFSLEEKTPHRLSRHATVHNQVARNCRKIRIVDTV
ncbi:TPA: hypothetical protein I7566_06630 [Vibrio cholerae]|uniref:Uncharacterized protein n=5 Tax=Vibrio cholerae TaxID=666 RepID=Q9KPA5_VIBCH|nr:hypothetical protein VC_2468 [Vibrio cholerae O1 biovar El Tor str. N16961]ACP06689.1 conserved hypothetical protein [Vibrio cholerae M66-2]ANR86604.1 hypothetical protein BBB50_02470 [Vibrio cholerae 2740-80]ARB82508.1 hypothetical protein A6J62_18935 [Vibrio cholerae]AVH53455.1 hypothetical protein C4E16_09490 [Vibrio cholerae O1 biovar El Tor]EET23713.1 conserved hypothetical protein [Vibrio cholerae MO10]EYC48647.1 hypothetical protein AZ32_07145 [Vibrio cholerae O1 biovar El Tor str. 